MAKFIDMINDLKTANSQTAETNIFNKLSQNNLIQDFIELATDFKSSTLKADLQLSWLAYFISKFPEQAFDIIAKLNTQNFFDTPTITRDTAKWLLANNADTDFTILNNFFTKIHVASTDNIAKLLQAAWIEADKAAKRHTNPDVQKLTELQTSLPTIFSKLEEGIQTAVLTSVLANVNDNTTYSKEFRTAIVLAALPAKEEANIVQVSNAITALHTADTTASQNQSTKTPERLYFIWDISKKDSNTLTALFAGLSPAEKQAVLASVLADVDNITTYSKEFRTAVIAAALKDTNSVEQVSNAIQSLHDNTQPIKTATRFNFAWAVSANSETAAAASSSSASPTTVTPNKFAAKLRDIFLGLDLTAKEKILGNVVNYPNKYDADFIDSIVTFAINDSYYISTFAEQFNSEPKIKILRAAPPVFQAKILEQDKTPGRFKSILIDPKPIYETSAGQEFFEDLTLEQQCNLLRYLNTNNKSDIKDTFFKSVGKGTQTKIINEFLAKDDDQKLAFNLFDSLEPLSTGEKLTAAFSDPQINILNSTKLQSEQAAKLVLRAINKSADELYEFLTKFHAPKRKLMFDALLSMKDAEGKNEGYQAYKVINHLLQSDSDASKKMAHTLFHQTGFDKVEYEKWGKQVVSRVTHPTGYLRRQWRKRQQQREEIANGHTDGTLKNHIISTSKKQAGILANFPQTDAGNKIALSFFNKVPSNSIRRAAILNELYKTNQNSAIYLFNEGASTVWFEDKLDAKAKVLGSNVVDPETKSALLNNINNKPKAVASFQRARILLSKEINAAGRIELFQGLTPAQQKDTLKEMQRTRHYFSSMNKNYYAREWFNKIVDTDVPDPVNNSSTIQQSAAKTRAGILTSHDVDSALYTTRFGRRLFNKLNAADKAETLVEMANENKDAATTLFSYSSFFSSHKSVNSTSARKNDRLEIIKHLLQTNNDNDNNRLELTVTLLVSLSPQKQNQLLAHLTHKEQGQLFNKLDQDQQQAILNVKSEGKKTFTANYLSLADKVRLLNDSEHQLDLLKAMDSDRTAEVIAKASTDTQNNFFSDNSNVNHFKKLNTATKKRILIALAENGASKALFNDLSMHDRKKVIMALLHSADHTDLSKALLIGLAGQSLKEAAEILNSVSKEQATKIALKLDLGNSADKGLFQTALENSLPLVGNGKILFSVWVQVQDRTAAKIDEVLKSLPDNKREKYFNCLNETKKSEVIAAAENAATQYPFYKSPTATTLTYTTS